MSIIDDAIKKARKQSGRPEAKSSSVTIGVPDAGTSPLSPAASTETRWTIIVIISLIVSISLLGSVFLYRHLSRINSGYRQSVHASVPSDIKGVPTAVKRLPLAQKSLAGSGQGHRVILNGIVYGPNDKWAIINDRIVRENDDVPGGKLILIKKDLVKIEKSNGEEIVLNLR